MKKLRKLVCAFLALLMLVSASGCSEIAKEAIEVGLGTTIEKPVDYGIGDVKIKDKKSLYEGSDPTEVVTMYLTVSTGNAAENTDHTWEEVNSYSVYDYEKMGVDRFKVAGLLQVGNEEGLVEGELGYGQVSPNCTVQVRGQSSSRNPQKNYKISIKDNKGTWNNQKTIALNKHQGDGLRFRNKFAYDLIAGIDEMLGLRTTFVHLYVKDTTEGGLGEFVDYGLYTQVEQLNKTALKAHGLDKNGHLYKINLCEFYRYEDAIKLTTDPGYDFDAFEEILETKGNDDHSKLIKMLEDVNDYSLSADEVLEKHFDIENMSYWMAFQILIGNIDTQNRNFYIYSPLNSEKWYIYSWDNDASFMRTEYQFVKRIDQEAWEKGVSNYWGNVLFQRALKSEKYRQALDAAIEDIKAYMTKERIDAMVDTYVQTVKPFVYSMPDAMYAPITSEQYDVVAEKLIDEIEANYKFYKDSFLAPMPFYIGVPRIEEGKLRVDWDNAYDFEARDVTYSFELARDYEYKDVIFKTDGIVIPTISFDKLPAGQYFMRVMAENSDGYTQYAFDYYILSNGKVYGTKCFYVDEKGSILEDVYVES